MNEKIETTKNNVKNHFKKNKKFYIGAGVGAGVSIIACVLVTPTQISISNPAIMNYKPIANTVQVQMTRPGPKAFVVQCLEDQKTWPSIRAAAKDLGIDPWLISKHLKGLLDNVDGQHFTKVAEI